MTTDKDRLSDEAVKAANREYAKKYYEAHKAEAHERYLKNREAIKARAALWRLQNRERYLKQQAEYDKTKRKYPAGEDTHPLDQKPGKNERSPRKLYYPPRRW